MGFRPLNRSIPHPIKDGSIGERFLNAGREPLWKGPQKDGITYSMLTKYLQCKDRFWLKTVCGLQEPHEWDHKIEYGSMWHECEEALAGGKPWQPPLEAYYQKLLGKYPSHDKDITKWYLLCKMQFPIYIEYHKYRRSDEGYKPLFQELSFCEPLVFPIPMCDKIIFIRGKIDSAKISNGCVWIQENKTKGEIDQDGISLTVDQNLQTMLYHLALRMMMSTGKVKLFPVAGTIYNVIRRPLSDRFAPRQGKKETQKAFIERVGKKIAAEPQKHFFRWPVPIAQRHIDRFRRESFDPILADLNRWWDGFNGNYFSPEKNPFHYRFPFGVYHSMERGYRGDAFDYYTSGSKARLEKVTNLFPELHK